LNDDTRPEELKKIHESAAAADHIILASYIWISLNSNKVIDEIRQLCEAEVPVTLISFGGPYIVWTLPWIDNYLCAYSSALVCQEAAAEALMGRFKPQGKLPISFPGLYPLGHRSE
jgi:beta-N-acetylhexosaminidase